MILHRESSTQRQLLPNGVCLAAVLALSVSPTRAFAEAPAAREYVKTWRVRESSGRVEANVLLKQLLVAKERPSDTSISLQIGTESGSYEVRTDSREKPNADGDVITSEIRSVETGRKVRLRSGRLEQNHDKPDLSPELVFKKMTLRAGDVSLEVSELKSPDLLAGKLSAKELAAFREAVPPELVGFCELLVRASDLFEIDDVALLLATVAAPKGTRMDATRQGWYVTDEKTSVRSIPIQQEPAAAPPGPGETEERLFMGQSPAPTPPPH